MDVSDRVEQHLQNAIISKALGASFPADVNRLLQSLGYTYQANDEFLLNHCMLRANEEIRNACNVKEIPQGLYYTAVEIVVGEFLFQPTRPAWGETFSLMGRKA